MEDILHNYKANGEEIQPPLNREIYKYGGYVVKRILQPDETNYYGEKQTEQKYQSMINALNNECILLEALCGKVPVPKMFYVDVDKGICIQSMCEGVTLDTKWEECSVYEKQKIKEQINNINRVLTNESRLNLLSTYHHPQQDILKSGLTLAHCDLHQSNIFVDNEYNITGVIDWEHANYYDVESVIQLHNKTHQPQDWYDIYDH